ncbi:hypothetical protein LMH87_006372 [Akanthomyces muscarius]|uniref:DUF899-domain-containing protein n=1 Tax=Akanthomyces muscarius TaxID=2231603 RepID=A0A9W8USR6_AKAMU|nr:hypothetical protein LMH87_006372 [Akanthomyces muscarius]KAJ4164710.1 hypothetical protein LMH87_006372 [Akanthomyces muscarius]
MPPKIVSQQEWIEASKALLEKEKELMRAADALSAARRELPMVRVDKDYTFAAADGSTAPRSLADLFDGMDQLIVYHFMFGPDDERGCGGCAHIAGSLPDVRHLRARRTQLACVSRAAPDKLRGFEAKCGWTFPWYSTVADAGNEFNRDFHVSIDQRGEAERTAPGSLFNFRSKEELEALGKKTYTGEYFGFSVFMKNEDGEVFHTYSTYGRGVERVSSIFALLDITPLGRQDEPGGPGAFKLKYEYEQDA